MDRAERAGLNDLRTLPTIPEIIAIQRRVAAETHCAFFDTFQAMGGDGTMARWYTGHPRLVAADFIHPTPQGAAIVAKLLVDNLDLGYRRWKQLHGITGVPAPLTAAQQGAPPPPAVATPAAAANAERARQPGSKQTVAPAAAPRAKPSAAVPEPPPSDPLQPPAAEPSSAAPPPAQTPQ